MSGSIGDSTEDDDPHMEIETGRQGQRLVVEGWFASHADSGSPGPHLHLRTSDRRAMVIRADQVPSLVDALAAVARRIEDMWSADGDQYAADVVLRTPDPQDPRVAQAHLERRLGFVQSVLDNLPVVMQLLTEASSTDEAITSVALILDTDEAEVLIGLARFDLLALTRPATSDRLAILREPQD